MVTESVSHNEVQGHPSKAMRQRLHSFIAVIPILSQCGLVGGASSVGGGSSQHCSMWHHSGQSCGVCCGLFTPHMVCEQVNLPCVAVGEAVRGRASQQPRPVRVRITACTAHTPQSSPLGGSHCAV